MLKTINCVFSENRPIITQQTFYKKSGCKHLLLTIPMTAEHTLERFIIAQEHDYENALAEIKNGKKRSHWMWYIFPQISGLGITDTSRFYGIKNMDEAQLYADHPLLGNRLIEISKELLKLKEEDPLKILGSPDHLKLNSSMTLFSQVKNADPIFRQVLEKFFKGTKDMKTLQIIKKLP